MSEEHVDILDEQGNLTGRTCTYEAAHEQGLIHRAVHVWIVDTQNNILLQKRSSDRRAYPNFWDISASGHVSAGENSLNAARRETEEELSLSLPTSMFKHLCTLQEHIVLQNGRYVNNEFQEVYVVQLEHFKPHYPVNKEVSETKWVGINEFAKLVREESKLVPHAEEYEQLLSSLRSDREGEYIL